MQFALRLADAPSVVLLDMNFTPDTTSGTEGIEASRHSAAARLARHLDDRLGHGGTRGRSMKHGARDYVTKPWDNARLLAACRTQIDLERRGAGAQSADVGRPRRAELDGAASILARSSRVAATADVLQLVGDVAQTEATVLITGRAVRQGAHCARALRQQLAQV